MKLVISPALMRVCLFVSTLASTIGILSLSTVYAIEPTTANNVNKQSEDYLFLESDLASSLITAIAGDVNPTEPIALSEHSESQQLESTPIATQFGTEHVDFSAIEPLIETTSQTEDGAIDSNWLTQITPVSQITENRAVEEPTEASELTLASEIDAVDTLESPDLDTL